ncbi:hypothetical protein PUR49_00245, partial [Streptomyces sp. BE147]|nr:hypothetical protein [Streptomyces sp. BE147]
ARPGRTHNNTTARHDHILAYLRAAGLGELADLGFCGLDNGSGIVPVGHSFRHNTPAWLPAIPSAQPPS